MKKRSNPNYKTLLSLLLFIFTSTTTHAQFFNSVEDNSVLQLGPRDSVGNMYYQADASIVKVDSLNQTVLWQLDLGVPATAEIYVADADTSRNVIVSNLSSPTSPHKTTIRSISPSGNLLWTKEISDDFISHAPAYLEAKDKSIYLGVRSNGYQNEIIKLNAAGNLVWAKAFQAQNLGGSVGSIIEKRNGNLIVWSVGYFSSDFVYTVFELTPAGNLVWNKCYKVPGITSAVSPFCSKINSNGDLVISENIQLLNQGTWPLIIKTDSLGVLKWAKRISSAGSTSNLLYDLAVEPNNAIVLSQECIYPGKANCEILRFNNDSCQLLNASVTETSFLFSLRAFRRNHIVCAGSVANSGRALVCKLDSTFAGLCDMSATTAIVSPFQVLPLSFTLIPLQTTVSIVPILDTLSNLNNIRYEACKDIVGLSENKKSSVEQLQIFPQPAHDILTVMAEEACSLRLYNQLSQLVLQQTIVAGKNNLDVSTLPKGIYYLRSETTRGVCYNKRLLIE